MLQSGIALTPPRVRGELLSVEEEQEETHSDDFYLNRRAPELR